MDEEHGGRLRSQTGLCQGAIEDEVAEVVSSVSGWDKVLRAVERCHIDFVVYWV